MSTPRRPALRRVVPALLLLLATVLPARAQDETWHIGSLQPTRAELEALLREFREAGRAGAADDEGRIRAANQAELIRLRLRDGDFQPGDQVQLTVEGETALSAQFTVAPGPRLVLPGVGDIPLRGVLRSELDAHLRRELGRFLREPVVQSRSLVRLGIMGQVRTPGFYVLPADALLSDALMAAGGPLPTARLQAMRVERGTERIWTGAAMRQALSDGRTLDQMNLRAGDNIHVPEESGSRSGTLLRAATVIPGAVLAVMGLIRVL